MSFSNEDTRLFVALIAITAIFAHSLFFTKHKYEQFVLDNDVISRQKYFIRRLAISLLKFTVFSIILLFFIGRLSAIWTFPHELDDFRKEVLIHDWGLHQGDINFISRILPAEIIIPVVISAIAIPLIKHKKRSSKALVLGNVQPLIPRNIRELRLAFFLCISSGLGEELFFRILMPISIFEITRNMILSLSLSIVIFGLMHIYQNWTGVLGTTIFGLLSTVIYLVSGNIFLAILLHILLNMRMLVFGPIIMWALDKSRNTAFE